MPPQLTFNFINQNNFYTEKGILFMKHNKDLTQPMKLVLDACPNPDYKQTEAPAPRREVLVGSYRQASQVVQAYIKEHNLGGGNWSGGQILAENGIEVACVSYNGRVWVGGEGEECVYSPSVEQNVIQPDLPMPEMKPCPFCGESNLEQTQMQISGENEISCLTCGISIHFDVDLSEEEVLGQWNKRLNYWTGQPRESLNIGDQAIYIGQRHSFIYNRKVQVAAVYKKYFIDPSQCVTIRDRQALAEAGGIEPAEDMLEVQLISYGRLLAGGHDTCLAELRPFLTFEMWVQKVDTLIAEQLSAPEDAEGFYPESVYLSFYKLKLDMSIQEISGLLSEILLNMGWTY